MSIQPNRVIARIIEQVDHSGWPRLTSAVYPAASAGDPWVRLYRSPALPRYATALHFWVHALRDELSATGRRRDLVGAAGHALCRSRSAENWLAGLEENVAYRDTGAGEALRREIAGRQDVQLHRMLESECRESSVLDLRNEFIADFRVHGAGPSWRRTAGRAA